MSTHNDGGAAFPVIPACDDLGEIPAGYPFPETGMSLRDWFAGQALAGLAANPQNYGDYDEFAKRSYLCADAMLKAREVSP